jgi:hypothetical protein
MLGSLEVFTRLPRRHGADRSTRGGLCYSGVAMRHGFQLPRRVEVSFPWLYTVNCSNCWRNRIASLYGILEGEFST